MRVLRFMSNLWISFSTCTKLKNVINKHNNINIYLLALIVVLKKNGMQNYNIQTKS